VKWREFITLTSSAAVAWPLATVAQQSQRMRRVGVLMPTAADDGVSMAWFMALLQGSQELGWTNDRNVRIDIHWAASNADDARKYSAELVTLAPDVIMAGGSLSLGALLQTTRAVPIVFALVTDPGRHRLFQESVSAWR
jgi:putative tryptophan/tyrosine transport system substrate-binding protein